MKKTVKVLTTAALLASLAAPFAAPAYADSKNVVSNVKSVADDYESNTTTPVSTLIIKEDNVDFAADNGKIFRVTLPSGVEFVKDAYAGTVAGLKKAEVNTVSERTLELKISGTDAAVEKEAIEVPLYVKVNGATGELKATIDSIDTTITPGSYTFATVSGGKTATVVEEVKTIGKNGNAGTIRIDETNVSAVGDAAQELTVKIPSGYEWNIADADLNKVVRFAGGFSLTAGNGTDEGTYKVTEQDSRTLKVAFNPNNNRDQRGSIYIESPAVKVDTGSYGDITASISGTKVSDADVVIAKYADWGVGVKVDKVEELVAGKVDDKVKTGKITIEENVVGSLIGGRDIDVELPSWVKVVGYSDDSVNSVLGDTTISKIDGSKSKFSITVGKTATGTTKGKIELKLILSIQGDKAGDIEATISGAGMDKQNVVIAKAIAPVTAASEEAAAKVKIGMQEQAAPSFVITEGVKEGIEKTTEKFKYTSSTSDKLSMTGNKADTEQSSNGIVTVTLPSGVSFSATPKVEVVDGNGEIEVQNVKRADANNGTNNQLVIPVKSESTKPMKIKVSDVKLTVDRTVPEGKIEAKVGGNAIIENNGTADGQFNTGTAAKFVIAETVTPAPGDTTASNIVFKLNSKTFTVDGKEQTMDAAPLVAWDRAFLPVRFAANALNVSDSNIVWDDKTSTATIFKGDRVIVAKVGDKFLTVNGAKVPMDVPVYRSKATNDRVMIPVRFLANALNADIQWNQETNEIVIKAAK